MMRGLLLLLALTLTVSLARADTFTIPLKLHQANRLLEAQRFRDAETLLTGIYASMADGASSDPDRYMLVLEMLAKSRSQQGKPETVLDLLLEQHRVIADHFHHDGYVYAGSLSHLAEAHYRDGQINNAIEFAERAIAIYQSLTPTPEDSLRIVQRNKAQYQIAPFSAAFLPLDLSDFYTRCEQLAQYRFPVSADDYMLGFVEVGVDYQPVGPWIAFFNALKYPTVQDYEGRGERRVFIPDLSASMRDEVCIVEESNGIVINAMSIVE